MYVHSTCSPRMTFSERWMYNRPLGSFTFCSGSPVPNQLRARCANHCTWVRLSSLSCVSEGGGRAYWKLLASTKTTAQQRPSKVAWYEPEWTVITSRVYTCIYSSQLGGRYIPLNYVTYTLKRLYPENQTQKENPFTVRNAALNRTNPRAYFHTKRIGLSTLVVSYTVHARSATHLLVSYRSDRSLSPGTPSASCRSGSVTPSTRHPPEPGPDCGPCGAAAGAGTGWLPGSSEVRWSSDGFVEPWQLPHLPD